MFISRIAAVATSSPLHDCPPAAGPRPPVPAIPPGNQHPASPPENQQWNARMWAILFVLCGALFLDALDVSMIGVALPVIRTDLHMSTSSLQWVVSAYVLGYGGFLLL